MRPSDIGLGDKLVSGPKKRPSVDQVPHESVSVDGNCIGYETGTVLHAASQAGRETQTERIGLITRLPSCHLSATTVSASPP